MLNLTNRRFILLSIQARSCKSRDVSEHKNKVLKKHYKSIEISL